MSAPRLDAPADSGAFLVASPATEAVYQLAEGPAWDARTGALTWVDMVTGRVLTGTLDGSRIHERSSEQRPGLVAAALPTDDGGRLVVERDRLVRLGPDAAVAAVEPLPLRAGAAQVNDAACDPRGRLLYGTKGSGPQALYRREFDGAITLIDDDLTLSNGIAWSPDGATLYHADTFAGVVWSRTYDSSSGRIGPRRSHVDLGGAWPDGIAVDVAGRVWVAVWGAGEVRGYGVDGVLEYTVAVAAPHTSSVCFAGAEREVLVITTARDGLTADQLAEWPESGRVFLVDAVAPGVIGTAFRTAAHA